MIKDLIPSQDEMKTLTEMAKYANDSKFFGSLGGVAGIMSIALYSRELGLPPMQCLMGGMHCIQGKIELSARMMNAMVRKAGHKIEIIESNSKICRLKGTRSDDGTSFPTSFTIEDAKTAGLVRDKTPWVTYPEQMLFSKCMKKLCTFFFADIIGASEEEGLSEEIEHAKKQNHKVEHSSSSEIYPTIEVKPEIIEPVSMAQAIEISNLVGDDIEYRDRIFKGYSKKGLEVKDYSDLPKSQFDAIVRTIKARNEQKLQDEMSNRVEA